MPSDFCPGDRIVDPAFMSASLRRDVAEFFGASVLEITIPIGAKAIYLGELSIPSHSEVLINRGSTLSIDEVDVAARTARATLLQTPGVRMKQDRAGTGEGELRADAERARADVRAPLLSLVDRLAAHPKIGLAENPIPTLFSCLFAKEHLDDSLWAGLTKLVLREMNLYALNCQTKPGFGREVTSL